MLEYQTQSGPSSKKEVGRKRVKEMAQPLGALDGLAADLACLLNGGAGSLPTNELRTNSLLTGKSTGDFANSADESALWTPLCQRICGSCHNAFQYFSATEQGIITWVSGNYMSLIRAD